MSRHYVKILFITEDGSAITLQDLPREDLIAIMGVFHQLYLEKIKEDARMN